MTIDQQLRQLRPKLRDAAPLVHKIVWGFVLFNAWLGLSLWGVSTHSLSQVIIVGRIITLKDWAIIFWLIGAGLLYGLLNNSWRAIRIWMSIGVFIKAIWFYALLALAIKGDFTTEMGVLGLWFFAAYVQVVAVAHFLPPKVTTADLYKDVDGKY